MALDTFPALIGQGFIAEKAPLWKTEIAEATSGRERRRELWSFPKWRFKIAYDVLRSQPTATDLATLFAFFNKHRGRSREWLFVDASDKDVVGQAFGTGNGTITKFQLLRTMNSGGFLFTEPVRGVSGIPTIRINGSVTTAWTLDDFGIVTFTSAPASGATLTWTGSFAFHVRFDQDDLTAAQMMEQLWSQGGLKFTTVKR